MSATRLKEIRPPLSRSARTKQCTPSIHPLGKSWMLDDLEERDIAPPWLICACLKSTFLVNTFGRKGLQG